MTEPQLPSTARFATVIVAIFVVAATITLPDVWLRAAPAPPVPEDVFDSGPSDQVNEWVCINDECFFATDSLVTRRRGNDRVVEWVINPENPLTDIPLTTEGREEPVGIAAVRAVNDTLYLQLESGRVVSRTRDGVWRPSVADFRNVTSTAAAIALLAAAMVVATGWARSRRVDTLLLVVAGVGAALSHLPITIWRHTTSFSLSAAAVVSVLVIGGSLVAGYLIAGPRHSNVTKRYIPGI